MESLWGEEFTIPDKSKEVIKKTKEPKKKVEVSAEKAAKSKTLSNAEKVAIIRDKVYSVLGQHKSDTRCIYTKEDLHDYISKCIDNGVIAIDTETNYTTNTFIAIIRGACIYTPGEYSIYIPINHINPETNERIEPQITEEELKEEFARLSNTKILMHNSTFDIEVIQNTCGIKLQCYWDTMSAAMVLDENELKGLKHQYILHINPDQSKYSIDSLFEKMDCGLFDPELFALYAATDALMTYQLYEYQKAKFEEPDNKEIYDLFLNIEMPIIDVVVDMETTGVMIDTEFAKKMSIEYHKRSDEIQVEVDKELERLAPQINAWKLTPEANAPTVSKSKTGVGKSLVEKLSDPIDLGSPTQLGILLYDILKVPVVDKDSPRGTGSDILEELSNKVPICEMITRKRKVDILINTFIDKMPEVIEADGRVHAKFNTCGTQTGRFSSSDPNLQNIPSHDKLVRMMFRASDGYSILGSDYSGQEPRSTCALAQDSAMQKAYQEGKDLYAVIAAACFHNNYEDNLEFHPVTHVLQPEGKARRSKAKVVLLGITYGMGPTSLASNMNLPLDEAKRIINDFYTAFPGVKKLTEDSQEMLKRTGYVTDAFGRRRHIPDAQLDEYEIKSNSKLTEFNPLIGSVPHEDESITRLIQSYKEKLTNAKSFKDRNKLIAEASAHGLSVRNNGGFINRALRQCLNARIQGTAASMTKLAMIMIHNDEELNRLGFRLLVTVHDEVFGEAPTENSERAAERLCEVMVEAAKVKCNYTPWKCDPYVVKRWYSDEASAEVLKDYNKMISKGMSEAEANVKIKEKYASLSPNIVDIMIKDEFDPNKDFEI